MRRSVQATWQPLAHQRAPRFAGRNLSTPLTLEERALPSTILAAFLGLLAIQIVLAL
jgi:hypothetical protein